MFLSLTVLRLRCYASATANALMRHWQAVVIAALLVPGATPLPLLIKALAYPVTDMIDLQHGTAWYASRIVFIQLLALVWVIAQRKGLSGGRFARYVTALPIRAGLFRRVNVTLLLLVDGILMVPILAATVVAPPHATGLPETAFHAVGMATLVSLTVIAQLAVLEKRLAIIWAVIPGDLLWALGLGRQAHLWGWVLLALAFCGSAAWMTWGYTAASRRATRTRLARLGSGLQAHFVPLTVRIQGKALFVDDLSASTLRIGMALLVAYGADLVIQAFGFDARALPAAIVAMAIAALAVSGLYRSLFSAHLTISPFTGALPLKKGFWMVRDTAFVTLLGALPLAVILYPLFAHGGFPVITLAALALTNLALTALLRLPQVFGGRQALLLGIFLATFWSGAAIASIR